MKENRSVTRILSILELIASHPEGLTLGEIYRMLDMPKATAYDFLQTLYKADAIYYKDPRLKNYVIGSKMFSIGSVYAKNSNLIEASQFDLKDFADLQGKTVFATKRVNGKIVYVFKYQPSNSKVNTPQEIGSITSDFNYDPIGMCYAAFDHQCSQVDIADKDQIKTQRHVYKTLKSDEHIESLCVPVYNFENRVVGVVAAMDLVQANNHDEETIQSFIKIGERISRKLGYLGNFNE